MKRTQGNGINLYESYLQQSKRTQGEKSGKLLTLVLPLALVALLLLGFAGKLLLDNREKSAELTALDGEIASLTGAYDNAQALEARRDEAAAIYERLAGARFLFTLPPAPTKALFTQVRACAEGVFNISQYDFNAATGVLTIDASAASVNEVPQFVQRLRDTGLFSLVQYTGYTSRDTTEYFCTVDCTLDRGGEYALTDALSAEGAESADAAE